MQEVKCRFEPTDLARLDAEAAAAGTSRAELIRQRALAGGLVAGLTTAEYHRIVADAAAFMHGDLSHQRIELLVAYVLNRLHQAKAGRHSAA